MQFRPPPPRLATRRILIATATLAALAIWLSTRSLREPVAATSAAVSTSASPLTHSTPDPAFPKPAAQKSATERAAEEWRPAPKQSGTDASNFYKNAFVLFDQLTEEEKQMIRKPREEVDAEKAAALFEKVRGILALLRDAAKADYCDWGLAPYSFDTPLRHIGKAQDLAKAGLWAAAYQFSTDPAAALETLADRATLGHHLGDTLIGVLVQSSIEAGAHELLAQHAPSFDAAMAARTREWVKSSKLDGDIARAFETEVEGSTNSLQRLQKMSDAERMEMVSAMSADKVEEARMKRLYEVVSDPTRLAAEVAFLAEMNRSIAKALILPEADYQAWRAATERQVTDAHPMAQLILPSFDQVQKTLQRTRVQRTMLEAGLAVQHGGIAALTGYRDPATGRTFTHVPTPAGFELRSTYRAKEKPVTMTFSNP